MTQAFGTRREIGNQFKKLVILPILFFCVCSYAEDSALAKAIALIQENKPREAASVLTAAIEVEPKDYQLYKVRARAYQRLNDHSKAGDDLTHVSELFQPEAFRSAGEEYFFAGKFDASIAAFDAFAKHFPDQASQLWERGISLYYAGRYADGRKQFEDHKTVNPHDVENAAWHFICAAKEMGVEKARGALIFIDTDKDTRVPMKQVYQLFKGDAKEADVMAAATVGEPDAESLKNNLCYAHLYLGLYFEALGDEKKAREHLEKAAVEFPQTHYMGQVARVHWALIKDKK